MDWFLRAVYLLAAASSCYQREWLTMGWVVIAAINFEGWQLEKRIGDLREKAAKLRNR